MTGTTSDLVRAAGILLLALVAAVPLAPAASAQGDDFSACIREAAASDLAAKTAFQTGFFDLIAAGRPEFEALASLNRDLQLALAQSRQRRFDYLLLYRREAIRTDSTLSAFRNFDWTERDEAAFRRENEDYRALADRIAELRGRNDDHPDWPELRVFFKEEMTNSPAYRDLLAALQENDKTVAALLESCPQR
jgi:hypothetical protein